MIGKLFVFAFLCAVSFSIRLHSQGLPNNFRIVGGWSTGNSQNPDTQIDSYIRNQFPQLANAKLTNTETQVVSGMNYRYTYTLNGVSWKVTVWDKAWQKFRKVTGIQKTENKTDAEGKPVTVTTTTKIQNRQFADIARGLFKN